MYLILALLAAGLGYFTSEGGIGDITFAQLTLNKVFGSLFTAACYIGAVVLAGKSLENDQVWPWRWRFVQRLRSWRKRRLLIKSLRREINRRQKLGYEVNELQEKLDALLRQTGDARQPAA
jgi:hypothetical protein